MAQSAQDGYAHPAAAIARWRALGAAGGVVEHQCLTAAAVEDAGASGAGTTGRRGGAAALPGGAASGAAPGAATSNDSAGILPRPSPARRIPRTAQRRRTGLANNLARLGKAGAVGARLRTPRPTHAPSETWVILRLPASSTKWRLACDPTP